MDVYGDNRGILADCVDELQPFIEEVLPNAEQDNVLVTESMDVVINAKSYLSSRISNREAKFIKSMAITAIWKTYVRFWLYFLYFL